MIESIAQFYGATVAAVIEVKHASFSASFCSGFNDS